MSKRLRKVVSALLVALMVLTTASAMDIMASAAGDKTVTAQFIVDNNGKYMETLEETFSCTSRTAKAVMAQDIATAWLSQATHFTTELLI